MTAAARGVSTGATAGRSIGRTTAFSTGLEMDFGKTAGSMVRTGSAGANIGGSGAATKLDISSGSEIATEDAKSVAACQQFAVQGPVTACSSDFHAESSGKDSVFAGDVETTGGFSSVASTLRNTSDTCEYAVSGATATVADCRAGIGSGNGTTVFGGNTTDDAPCWENALMNAWSSAVMAIGIRGVLVGVFGSRCTKPFLSQTGASVGLVFNCASCRRLCDAWLAVV
jgi:hypothetical protein